MTKSPQDSDQTSLIPFEDEGFDARIRRTEHDGRMFFSVIDVIGVLTGSDRARKYWNDLKTKLLAEGYTELSANIGQLKLVSADGKAYKTDCADTETMLRIIQSTPSPKAEPFKQWLAKVGTERLREEQDPTLAIRRTRQHYARLGYSSEWIDARMATLESREAVTAEWAARGADERRDFAHLTETLHTHTFDISTGEHKTLKQLRSQQLRDNMSPMELILTALGEETARMVHINEDSQGVQKLTKDVASAGDIAGAARGQIEQLTGQSVVTSENAKTLRLGRQRELQPTLLPLSDEPER